MGTQDTFTFCKPYPMMTCQSDVEIWWRGAGSSSTGQLTVFLLTKEGRGGGVGARDRSHGDREPCVASSSECLYTHRQTNSPQFPLSARHFRRRSGLESCRSLSNPSFRRRFCSWSTRKVPGIPLELSVPTATFERSSVLSEATMVGRL